MKPANDELNGTLEELKTAQDDVIIKLQTKKKYEVGAGVSIDFNQETNVKCKNRVLIQDLTTDEQVRLGVNIFYMKVNKTTSSPVHEHSNQNQLIHVKEGMIFDKVAKIRFEKGESFFISKRNNHSLKYIAGSEILFIYIPSLTVVQNGKE